MIPSWFKPFAYGVYAINSLILLLAAVDYLFCEVDLFGIVWMSTTLLLVTVPIGMMFFIYSLFRLRHKEERCIAIWTAAMVLFFFVVFWLLPSGSSRVAAKMEKHCLRHGEEMLSIAKRLYAVMPDSTCLEYVPSGEVSLKCIDSIYTYWGNPIVKNSCMVDSDVLAPIPSDSINRVLKTLHSDRLIIYKPTGLALFRYVTSGFGSFWFEVSLTPYTEEAKVKQLNTYNAIPFSSHVCFRYHGGATDSDGPFPNKEKYVESLRQRGMLSEAPEIDSIVF